MKKKISLALVGLSLYMAPVAFADPVKLSGDISVKYEKDTADGEPDTSGTMTTFKLMAEKDLGAGWSLYARLGAQHATQPALADFRADGAVYAADKKTVAYLDQFGLNYQKDDFAFKFGRQDAAVGTTALLYSRPDTNIGKRAFVDGVSITGKVGVTEISALLAREDNPSGENKNKVYAVRAGYSPVENLNWGLTLGRYQGTLWNDDLSSDEDVTANHWAVDGTYTFGKNSLTGEYGKSSRSNDNKAYAITLNHDFDGKTAVYVTGFRVETNGDMGRQSDFDNGNRGVYYGITHKLNDATNMEIVYKDQKFIADKTKNTILEATLSYSF